VLVRLTTRSFSHVRRGELEHTGPLDPMRLAVHPPKPLLAHSHCTRVKTPNSFHFGTAVSGGLGDCNRCIAYHGTNRCCSADVPNDLLTLCSCRISPLTLLVGGRAGISKAGLIAARSFRIHGRLKLEDAVICCLSPQLFVRAAEEGSHCFTGHHGHQSAHMSSRYRNAHSAVVSIPRSQRKLDCTSNARMC
jgi:hypothetical protein